MAEKKVYTACPLDCWDACGLVAYVEQGRLVKVEGHPTHPVTRGFICNRGRRLVERLYHPKRILTPLKKQQGRWEKISWEQAFREIAEKMRRAQERYGPTAVMHTYDYGSGGLLKILEQRFFNLFGGYTSIKGSLCWAAGIKAQTYDFGLPLSHAPQDLQNARSIVVWGRNVPVTNIHMVPFIKEAVKKGTHLILINPYPNELTALCRWHVCPRPGSDGALALGIAHLLYARGTYDRTFVTEHAVGFSDFASYLQTWTPQRVEKITGVTRDELERLADLYAQGPVATLLGIGLQRYINGGNTIRAIDALCAMSGQVGRPGGGVHYANRIWKNRLDEEALTLPQRRQAFRAFSVVQQGEEILRADPPVEVLFITRSNPVSQVPNSARVREAYAQISTVVQVDQFLNDTSEYADYFLPCTSVFEEEDVLISSMWHTTMSYIHPVVNAQGEAKADWQIFAGLAERLGFQDEFLRPLSEWMETVLAPLRKEGITLQRLRQEHCVTLDSSPVPFADYRFFTPSGKYEFYSERASQEGATALPEYHEPAGRPQRQGEKYPYFLLTIHPRQSLHSQHYHLSGEKEQKIYVSPELARERGLQEGERVRVCNERGSITGRVHLVPGMQKETIVVNEGRPRNMAGGVNELTPQDHADLGEASSAQYDCYVAIEKEQL